MNAQDPIPGQGRISAKKLCFTLVRLVLVILFLVIAVPSAWLVYHNYWSAPTALLSSADKIELLSLQPGVPDPASAGKAANFHGYPILGTATITDEGELQKIRAVVKDNLFWGSFQDGAMLCFNPRHGLRIVQGGHELDLLVCFECEQIEVFSDNPTGLAMSSATNRGNGAGAEVFNGILAAHGLPAPPK